ncbi:hypothetical protein Dsin_025129 [Dipteronia sinensis]|uniref:DUF1985 domain-containing protein n=1 Tax=Dipteronia sinensis TaxID=43782 RepID=A0AAE0DY22_9ROSI|nr:hypothetical protein Dsin_025129 [Dipteronia sinensis]
MSWKHPEREVEEGQPEMSDHGRKKRYVKKLAMTYFWSEMRNTRYLRASLKTPLTDWYGAKITHHNHMENVQVIDEALDQIMENVAEERAMYQQSCFGHFQCMQQGMQFSSGIVHWLLLRELHHNRPSDEIRFMLDPHSVRFSRVEFCLIIGLKFRAIPDTELYEDVPNGIHHRYFGGRDVVTFAKLEARIEQGQWIKQFDAVKLCLLYMLNCVLIGAEERASVPIWQLRLVDEL